MKEALHVENTQIIQKERKLDSLQSLYKDVSILKASKNRWCSPDLTKNLLPYIEVDYLSLTPKSYVDKYEILEEFKKLNPYLKWVDLTKKDLSLSDQKFKSLVFSSQESKYHESLKYDVIFYSFTKQNINQLYIRVPGAFSHRVLEAFFTKQIAFTYLFASISRIDFKIQIPTFVYNNFESDYLLLREFVEIQNCKCTFDPDAGFMIAYVGARTSRQFIRTYLSKKRELKTYELELKKESARRYSEHIQNCDIYQFNKTVILELIESFSEIESCDYTKPLLEWNFEFLFMLRQIYFPGETYYKRQKRKDNVLLSDILSPKKYAINSHMINSVGVTNDESCLRFMILVYLSKILLEKWKADKINNQYLRFLMQKGDWNHLLSIKERFLETGFFSIDFDLKELLSFLNLNNCEFYRRKVLTQINNLMNLKFQTWIENDLYRIQYIYQFKLTHNEGHPISGSLILDPLVVLSLVNDAILLHEKFLKDYFKLLDKFHFNKTKKRVTYGFHTFFSVYLSFTQEDEAYIKNYFFSRKKDNRKTLKRQVDFAVETIKLASNHLKKDMCLRLEHKDYIPMEFLVLERILNSRSEKVLKKSEFFFQPRTFNLPAIEKLPMLKQVSTPEFKLLES